MRDSEKDNGGKAASLPDARTIIEYVRKNKGQSTHADIARHFRLKGENRRLLRILIKDLEKTGELSFDEKKRIIVTDALPAVAAIDVMSVSDDGDLYCMPTAWRGDADPPLIILSAKNAVKLRPPPGVGDRLMARLRPAGDDGYSAEIIRPIGKSAHRFLAVFHERPSGGVGKPVERRARGDFFISNKDSKGAKDGDLVWLTPLSTRRDGGKKARVDAISGHIDDPNAISAIALAANDIPVEFSVAAARQAETAALPGVEGREDIRETPLITIDPADAKDHDDALYAEPDQSEDNEGGFRIIVAIADVSYFVRSDDAIDREAQRRGVSVYLPDRVIPMLPERLSNDLCSLRENEDRPCLAVELVINKHGEKRKHRFFRAFMRSAAKLSYEAAQDIETNIGSANAVTTATVRSLFSAFRCRLKERSKRAPLDLDLPERKVILDESGAVINVRKRERFDAHRVVEEFMILANVAAAEELEQKRRPLIYRVHDEPDDERINVLRDYVETLGYSLAKGSVRPNNLNQLLAIAEQRGEKEMISDVVLRAQKQAVYATENVGHFGLNLPRYAHFTSPIRRYADLTVHRALVEACKLGPGGPSAREAAGLSKIAQAVSDFERRAIAAERESIDRFLAGYLEKRVGEEFAGRIRGVTKFGLFVTLDETGADGFVPIRTLGAERYQFDERSHALIGQKTGGFYHLGQIVEVRLAEAAPLTGGMRFDMISAPTKSGDLLKNSVAKKKTRKKPDKAAPRNRVKPKRRRANAKPKARY